MKHIYYSFAILAILWEAFNITSPKACNEFSKSIKLTKSEDYNTTQKTFGFLMLGYILWVFVGLFTFQWPVFVLILILSLIPKKIIIIRWIDAVIMFLLLLFILINSYHLHVNILTLFK